LNNSVLGSVSPAEFIPVAEDSGLIVPIGDWVLRRACFQNRLWQKLGYDPVKVAVNVSAIQFAQSDFVDSVAAALQWCSLDARYLELELTESVLMNDHAECSRRLERLRALGVLCSIDDFGTGYSSLQYLQKLPIHSLKIDLSFVRDIRIGQPTPPLIEAITGLAHGMQLYVIAEGVEEPHQLQALRDVGCDQAQGYLLGHPIAAEQVQDLFASLVG
jgi:EAL domain-containing protein (putative c-di-GMP-specific phosphodiesterase class I)